MMRRTARASCRRPPVNATLGSANTSEAKSCEGLFILKLPRVLAAELARAGQAAQDQTRAGPSVRWRPANSLLSREAAFNSPAPGMQLGAGGTSGRPSFGGRLTVCGRSQAVVLCARPAVASLGLGAVQRPLAWAAPPRSAFVAWKTLLRRHRELPYGSFLPRRLGFMLCSMASGNLPLSIARKALPNPAFELTVNSGPPHAGTGGFAHSPVPARGNPLSSAAQRTR